MVIEPQIELRVFGYKDCVFNYYCVLIFKKRCYAMLKRENNEPGNI